MAFAADRAVTVSQGSISFKGQRYTCRELQAYQGDRVSLRVPKYEAWSRLPVIDEGGRLLGFAEPDGAFGMLDPSGAVESHARAKAHREGLRQLERQAPKIDVPKLVAETVASLPAEPKTPAGGFLSYDRAARAMASGVDAGPDRDTRLADSNAEHRRKMSAIANSFLPPSTLR